jgi:hypothetical protein
MSATQHSPASLTQVDLKDSSTDEVENVATYGHLSPEDARWLADFPEESKRKVVRKVSLSLAE